MGGFSGWGWWATFLRQAPATADLRQDEWMRARRPRSQDGAYYSGTAMMNPGPPRVGPDPFWDWHHAFSLICRLDSRWRPKCPKQGEQ